MNTRWWWLGVVVTAVFVATVFVGKLGTRPIQNWDESIHAAVSHESLERDSWLDLWYRDGEYFRKPPLKFWLTSALFATIGENPWTVRAWSALAGIATTALLALWAWQLWRNRWLALLAAVVFASGRFIFFHSFRTGETDGLLVFFVTAALYSYWRSWAQSKWILLAAAATGFAVMTKSAGGLLPMIIIAIDLLVARRWPFQWKHVVAAIGIFLAIVLPWHVVQLLRHGTQFWNDYIGVHVVERATEQIHNQGVPWWWYGKIFMERFFPWAWWVPMAAIAALWRLRTNRQSPERLLLVWLIVTFLFFTASATKFDWYILPLYPAATLLVTPWLVTMVRRLSGWRLVGHTISFFAVLLVLPTALHPASVLRWLYPFTFMTDTRPTMLYVALMVVVIAMYVWLMTRQKPTWLPRATGIYGGGKLVLIAIGFSLLTIRAESPASSPLPALVTEVQSSQATTLYTKGVDLLNYPAAYYYFRTIPGVKLVDLEKTATPTRFTANDAVIVRDPAAGPIELREIIRVSDFRILLR